jgi:hypothetical protein
MRPGQDGESRPLLVPAGHLGRPGHIAVIKVGQVAIEDACPGRLASDNVPHSLVQASGDQIPARQVYLRGPAEHLSEFLIAAQRGPEPLGLFVERQPPGSADVLQLHQCLPGPASHFSEAVVSQ